MSILTQRRLVHLVYYDAEAQQTGFIVVRPCREQREQPGREPQQGQRAANGNAAHLGR